MKQDDHPTKLPPAKALGLDALGYLIPRHANSLWYSLGGLTLGLIVWAVVTGIILSQYYAPQTDLAWDSVFAISADIPWLSIVRGVHYWSATLAVALVIVHLARVVWTLALRYPRGINFLVGLLLLGVLVNLYFTGTVLKWDQEGYEALQHFKAVNDLLGPLTYPVSEELTLTNEMLQRVVTWHISILPLILLVLLGLHLFYIRHHGISTPPELRDKPQPRVPFYTHAIKLGGLSLLSLGVLILLGTYFPPVLLNRVVEGVEATKPPLPFLVFYQLENWMGALGILVGSAIMVVFLLAYLAVANLNNLREELRVKLVRLLLAVGLLLWLIFTVWGALSPPAGHLGM